MKSCALAALAAAMISSGVASGLAVGDVLRDRAVEQERLLQHHADLLAQGLQSTAPARRAVDQDLPLVRVVEAAEQVDQRGLAGAAGADQADHLARLDDEADVVQHRLARLVAEGDVLELDPALDVGGA